MRRPDFITLVGSVAVWPAAAIAQQNNKKLLVGIITGFNDKEMMPVFAAFRARKNVSRSDYLAQLQHASIVATLSNLMSFPWISSRVAGQQLKLLGAYFDVGSGALEVYDPIASAFTPIAREDVTA